MAHLYVPILHHRADYIFIPFSVSETILDALKIEDRLSRLKVG